MHILMPEAVLKAPGYSIRYYWTVLTANQGACMLIT